MKTIIYLALVILLFALVYIYTGGEPFHL